jgi:hypothetical protein
MYARSGQSWQSVPSPPSLSPSKTNQFNDSNDSIEKFQRETLILPIHSSIMDFSTPLNISIKPEPTEQNSLSSTKRTKSMKQQTTTRRQHMICKKKLPQNGLRRRPCMNSVENQGNTSFQLSQISYRDESEDCLVKLHSLSTQSLFI